MPARQEPQSLVERGSNDSCSKVEAMRSLFLAVAKTLFSNLFYFRQFFPYLPEVMPHLVYFFIIVQLFAVVIVIVVIVFIVATYASSLQQLLELKTPG